MTGFDFIFALFSLVLGLAFAEVLGGFATVMKLHARARAGKAKDIRVGWLVPMLAMLVTLNQLNVWMMAYGVRDTLQLNNVTLLAVLVIVGAYYLFSVMVFPDDPADWPDFDQWYDSNNRLILSGLFAINLVMQIASAHYRPPPSPAEAAVFAAEGPVLLALIASVWLMQILLFALIFVRGRRLNVALLATLLVLMVGQAIGGAMLGL